MVYKTDKDNYMVKHALQLWVSPWNLDDANSLAFAMQLRGRRRVTAER